MNLTLSQRLGVLCLLAFAFLTFRPGAGGASAPIAAPGLKVAIIRDGTERITASQASQLGLIPEYVKSLGGEAVILEPEDASRDLADYWKETLSRPRTVTPWLIASEGTKKRGYEGPLPAETDKTQEIIQGVAK